jgi:Zn-dependent protease with chaperone function
MSNLLGLIQQALFFGFLVTTGVSLLSLLSARVIRTGMEKLTADARASLSFAWCLAPVLVSFSMVFMAFLPSLLQVLGLSNDHCLGHPEGHLHFCLVHGHPPIDSWWVWGPALAYLALLVSMGMHLLVDIVEMLRFSKRIGQLPHHLHASGITVLETATPLALTCGLFRQKIILSEGLLSAISDQDREIILLHERQHIARYDVLKKLLARSLSLAHFPVSRRAILQRLELAGELVCDNHTANETGDRTLVAELLLKVERLYQGHLQPGCAIASCLHDSTGSSLPARVVNLLGDSPTRSPRIPLPLQLAGLCCLLLAAHDLIHDELEHVINIFTKGA